jgi:hypothetical protein
MDRDHHPRSGQRPSSGVALGNAWPSEEIDLPLIAVAIPTEDEARTSAGRSLLLARAQTLVGFADTGRKLTQTGNLTLSDARHLVTLLETGDRLDETIGGRTFQTKSAADLPQLSFVVRLVTKARFVRVLKGQLVATKAGRALGVDPLADLARLVEAIDDIGVVTARTAGGRYIWNTLAPFFDDLFAPLTTLLLYNPGPTPFAELVDQAFDEFEAEIDLDSPHWDETRRHDFVTSEIATAMETLEAAGVAHWASEHETSDYRTTKRTGGTVTLTPAGRWALYHHLRETHGIPIESAAPPEHTDHDFETLIRAFETGATSEFQHLTREIAAWIDQRGDHAPIDLAHTARTTTDPAIRTITLAVLSQRFGPDAVPHVQTLLDNPTTRGAALVWLVDHEIDPAEALLDPDPAVFIDVLALTLLSRGPEQMAEVFDHTGNHDTQTALLDSLWRQPSPATGPVLDALGRKHPTPRIAKAARKAAMQHASSVANPRR